MIRAATAISEPAASRTTLQFADEAGKLRAALAVSAEGEPEMELLGRDDKVLWRAP